MVAIVSQSTVLFKFLMKWTIYKLFLSEEIKIIYNSFMMCIAVGFSSSYTKSMD